MTQVKKTALVSFSDQKMFDLVKDVDKYQEFLPWCSHSKLISVNDNEFCGTIVVERMGVNQSFSTCNICFEPSKIEIFLNDGPFKALQGFWQFEALNEEACKISLQLDFEFSNKLMEMAFGAVFNHIANTMVESFCKRAKEVYGA